MARTKKAVKVKLEGDFLEECRDAAWHVGKGWTLNKILEDGAALELERLEAKNKGPFAERQEELTRKPGREHGKHGEKEPRKGITFLLPLPLLERLRNAAAALGIAYTNIVEDGAAKVLDTLRRQHNGGEKFPRREGELPHA